MFLKWMNVLASTYWVASIEIRRLTGNGPSLVSFSGRISSAGVLPKAGCAILVST